MAKNKSKKKSLFLRNSLFICFIAWSGYWAGANDARVKAFINKGMPEVKRFAAKKFPELFKKERRASRNYALKSTKRTAPKTRNFTKAKAPPPLEIKELPSSSKFSDKIKLSSFNIRIFSNKSRDDEELKYIASILRYYDIVAIQELRDEHVLKRTVSILKKMGYDYDYEISPKVGRNVKEIYAFIYRKDKISVKLRGKLYKDRQDKFIREPFYATFKAGNFDFTLCTIHLLYGDNETHRRPELLELAKVYKHIQRENPGEKDIIMLGDFNFPPSDQGWKEIKTLPSMAYLIKPPAKTTISDRSLYDNFWFQRKHVKEYTGKSGVVKFDENIFMNDDRQARLAVSDHRPIWATFATTLPDDD